MYRILQSNLSRTAVVLATILSVSATIGQANDSFKLGLDGVGNIGASVSGLQNLRESHPDFVWEQAARPSESGVQTAMTANLNGTPVMTVLGDDRGRVARIEIVDPQIGNWLGPRLGDRYKPLRRNLQLGACVAGMEQRSGAVLCSAAETPKITYVFSGQWNGPDGQLPPEPVLNSWTVSEILWQPNRVNEPGPLQTASPGFDCADTYGSVEEMICNDPELMALDRRLNALYAQKIEDIDPDEALPLRGFQRGWIKARNDCSKSSHPRTCVFEIYEDRIAELKASLAHQLDGTSWRVVRIAGDHVPQGIDLSLTFGAGGQLNGTSGCNRYFATYAIKEQDLQIGQIGGTRMMCPELRMLAERRFLKALDKVNGWATQNNDLVLYGTGAELTLRRP